MNPNAESVPVQSSFTKSLNFTVESNAQNQNGSKFIRIFQQVLRDSQESSSLNWWSCNPNASTPPEVARCKRDHSVRSEKKKGKKRRISQRWVREEEGKFTSENPNQRIRRTDQNLRITNSGNSQTSSNHVEKTITEPQTMWIRGTFELFRSKTQTLTRKQFEKGQETLQDSQRVWIRVNPRSFHKDFIQEHKESERFERAPKREDSHRFNG